MLLRPDVVLESWRPDFSPSGQASPEWTRVRFGDVQICNSLESLECDQNPVQVEVCEECGYSECAVGNYIHLSTTQHYVAWTAPQTDPDDKWETQQYTASAVVRRYRGVLFGRDQWDWWAGSRERMPPASALNPANARAIADAWWWSAPPPISTSRFGDGAVLDHYVIASDSLGLDDTRDVIRGILRSLTDPTRGEFVEAETVGSEVQVVYLEAGFEWPCFAEVNGRYVPAVASDWVYLPSKT